MGDDIQKELLLKLKKVRGVKVSEGGKRITVPLHSDSDKNEGSIIMLFPMKDIILNLIEIHSLEIPENVANPVKERKELKINYCFEGRCELRLKTGGCTYLTSGEAALDAGQTRNVFYYPGGKYLGFEIILDMENLLQNKECKWNEFSNCKALYENTQNLERPVIGEGGRVIQGIYDCLRYYINESLGINIILLKCMETLLFLSNKKLKETKRTYCTASQVEIAKETEKIITANLSQRQTAAALSKRFGISETSLKNYFKNVYGTGFLEYQQKVRMEKAGKLLCESPDAVGSICEMVGYLTKAKFGAAFKDYFGMTPLEYRRRQYLKREGNGEEI